MASGYTVGKLSVPNTYYNPSSSVQKIGNTSLVDSINFPIKQYVAETGLLGVVGNALSGVVSNKSVSNSVQSTKNASSRSSASSLSNLVGSSSGKVIHDRSTGVSSTPSVNVGSVETGSTSLSKYLDMINRTASENSARSAKEAQIQREWQEVQNAKAMEFNALEAQKNRSWQEMMSNTAHQREISDLKAAGLNPVLSAMNGNGASVTSGATASGVTSAGAKGDIDTSANSALVSLLGTFLDAQIQLEMANINAETQKAVADKYTAMSYLTSQIAAAAGISQANIHSSASKYSSDQALAGSKYVADKGLTASEINAFANLLGNLLPG